MKVWLFAFVTLALATGCGKESSKGDDTPSDDNDEQAVFNLNGLNGTVYQADCWVNDDKTRSGLETIVFQQSSFEKVWVNFDGTTCDAAAKRSSYHYLLAKVKKNALSDLEGWETYTFEYAALSLVVHQQAIAEAFNKYQVYDHGDWQVEEPQDIAGRKYSPEDEPEFTPGTVRVVTVKIESDTFQFAAYKDGKANADDTYLFRKISP